MDRRGYNKNVAVDPQETKQNRLRALNPDWGNSSSLVSHFPSLSQHRESNREFCKCWGCDVVQSTQHLEHTNIQGEGENQGRFTTREA